MKLNNVESAVLLAGLYEVEEGKLEKLIKSLDLKREEKLIISTELNKVFELKEEVLDVAFDTSAKKVIYSLLSELKKGE